LGNPSFNLCLHKVDWGRFPLYPLTINRSFFDSTIDASSSSIAKNLAKLKELGVITHGKARGEYIVTILDKYLKCTARL
jgi:hypothetical protein